MRYDMQKADILTSYICNKINEQKAGYGIDGTFYSVKAKRIITELECIPIQVYTENKIKLDYFIYTNDETTDVIESNKIKGGVTAELNERILPEIEECIEKFENWCKNDR